MEKNHIFFLTPLIPSYLDCYITFIDITEYLSHLSVMAQKWCNIVHCLSDKTLKRKNFKI